MGPFLSFNSGIELMCQLFPDDGTEETQLKSKIQAKIVDGKLVV